MKKFTKVLASFCAMAMIFSVFSATVAAGEEDIFAEPGEEIYYDDPVAEEPAPEEPEKEPEEQQEEQTAKQAEEQGESPSEEPDKKPEEDSVDGSNDLDQSSITLPFVPAANAPDLVLGAPGDTDTESQVPFANGLITQDDIDLNGGKLPETAGTYTLAEDVTVSAGAKIETSDAAITIDLNGKTITYTGVESMYVLGRIRGTAGDNASMNTSSINWDDCATGVVLTINGTGTITGAGTTGHGSTDYWINKSGVGIDGSNNRGGCVLIEYGCKFILNGGTITDFEAADEGGAVCASNGSEFIMNGGTIQNCSAKKGGGVSGQASSATAGPGGVNVCASITINDGTIKDNTATEIGGGIRLNRCKIYLFGGEITGNNVKADNGNNGGGGIAYYEGAHGNVFELKGSPKVYGNTCKDNADVNRANIQIGNSVVMKLTGDLSSDAKLYVGAVSTAETVDIIKTNGKSFDIDSIFSDISTKKPYYNGSSLITLKPDTDPKIEGYQVVIGGDIKLRAALDLKGYADSSTSVTYAYSYTKGSKTVNVEKNVAFRDLTASGSYYTVDIPVESACITSPITITIQYSAGQVSGDPVTIDQYVTVIMNGDYTDKVKAVANSIRTFGSMAMLQFNINMNDSSLRPASEEINASLYDPQVVFNKYLIGEGAPYTPASDPDRAFYGASVTFLSKTEVNLYFKKSVLGDTAPAMTVTYANGTTETVSGTLNGSNYYMYTVKGTTGDGFAATLFDTPFSFAVGNVSGEYSVNTYLQVMEYKYHGQSSNILLKLVEAYYDFAKKCQQL